MLDEYGLWTSNKIAVSKNDVSCKYTNQTHTTHVSRCPVMADTCTSLQKVFDIQNINSNEYSQHWFKNNYRVGVF